MKAYMLFIKNDDDKGAEIVFANDSNSAKKQVWATGLEPDGYIDVRARRAPKFDDMEHLSAREMMKEKWRDNWWFDMSGYPDCENASDEEFFEWYDSVYK